MKLKLKSYFMKYEIDNNIFISSLVVYFFVFDREMIFPENAECLMQQG